jgi:molybdate transport system substrate-binding protein
VPRLALILALVLPLAARAESLTVAAAISLKDALTQIAAQYKSDTGDTVDFAFGSSGQLLAQIKAGAPIDAFIPAAPAQLDDLEKADLADRRTRRTIAANTLVLIAPADAKAPPKSFADLANPRIEKIAIGQPKTVPAGEYARQTLASLKLDKSLDDRLIYAANVRQVLDYVARNEVDAGLVYATDARQAGDKVKIVATAEESTHEEILYPAAVLKSSRKQSAARKFLDYLASEKARSLLKSHGFSLPAQASTRPARAQSWHGPAPFHVTPCSI